MAFYDLQNDPLNELFSNDPLDPHVQALTVDSHSIPQRASWNTATTHQRCDSEEVHGQGSTQPTPATTSTEQILLMMMLTSVPNSRVDARVSSADTEWSTIRFDNMLPWNSQVTGYPPNPFTDHAATTTLAPDPTFSQLATVPDVTNLPRPVLVGSPVSDVGFTSFASYKADDATTTTYP
ncbi:hypothetical protein V5O48_018273, partial [Marasmius crinis-equi]